MTALVVHSAGICSTVQDRGRTGYRACGVPLSGALDTVALELVNALVGNAPNCGALEMLYSGVTLQACEGAARIAVGGAASTITRARDGESRPHPAWVSTLLLPGDTIRVGPQRDAACGYLAVEGGLEIAPVLGSVSTYLRGALGGWGGRALRKDDRLPLTLQTPTIRAERCYACAPDTSSRGELRVMLGPQTERFEAASLDAFLSAEYRVSPSSDRSGLRLEGPALRHVGGYDLSSEAVATGSVQVPGSGMPVILIADHPTVGGYPKIATIISADLPAAGRLRIGSRVRFSAVNEESAARARQSAQSQLARTIAGIVDAGTPVSGGETAQ